MRNLFDNGNLLTPPIGSPVGTAQVRGPLIAATTITSTDAFLLFDALTPITQVLPSPISFITELRVIAVTQSNNVLTLVAPAGSTIQRIGEIPSAQITLGTLDSGAEYQAVTLVSNGADFQIVGGILNTGAKIPYGPVSQRILSDGASYEATDVLGGVVYQNQSGTIKAIAASPLSPVPITLPSITGTATVNSLFTANPGTWQGTPVPTLTYQWLRDGVPISAQTAQTYTIAEADLTHLLSVAVTSTNPAGTASVTSAARPIFNSASGNPAPQLLLLNSGGTTLNRGVILPINSPAPAGPATSPYVRFPAVTVQQSTETPAIRLYIHNWSVQVPVQPWLLNADSTLFGAVQGIVTGSPPTFPVASFALNAPAGFPATGGLLWVVGVGYVSYAAYDNSTGTFTGCDTRYAGTPAANAAVYQVILPRVEPGNMNVGGGTSFGQLNMRVPGYPAFGSNSAATRLAFQPLVATDATASTISVLAWLV